MRDAVRWMGALHGARAVFALAEFTQDAEWIYAGVVRIAPQELQSIFSDDQVIFGTDVSVNGCWVQQPAVCPLFHAFSATTVDSQVLGAVETGAPVAPLDADALLGQFHLVNADVFVHPILAGFSRNLIVAGNIPLSEHLYQIEDVFRACGMTYGMH